jgi:hypothetical protein
MEAKIKTEPELAEMEPEEFKKIFYNLMENGKKVEQEFRTDWINNNGLKGYLTDGGAIMTLEFPNGRILECRELYGNDVTIERRPSRSKELAKAKAKAAKAAKIAKVNERGDLVIPKEYRELVEKALKVAEIALNENKQATWIINMAQGKNKAKQIHWLLKNVAKVG